MSEILEIAPIAHTVCSCKNHITNGGQQG